MSALRHGFLDRERQDLEFLLARALAEDLGQKGDITSCSMIPAAAQARPGWLLDHPACLRGCRSSSSLPERSSPGSIGCRNWPMVIASSAAAWSGGWRAPCDRCLPSNARP